MAAMAHDNVIQFPDANRDTAGGPDRSRTLKASTDLLAQKLREALRALLPEVNEEMLTRGDLADEREQRNAYYGAHEILKQNAVRLEGLLAANWLRLVNNAVRGRAGAKAASQVSDLDDLQLVDFGDVDEDLAVKAIASRLRDGCEDGLFAVGRRLAFLAGRDEASIPVADLLADALHAAFSAIELSVPARLEVLRASARHVVRFLAPAIHDANAFLVGRNVLPKLRRSYVRPDNGQRQAGEANGSADAGDVFALLQRLVGAGNATAAAPAAGGPMSGGAFLPGTRESPSLPWRSPWKPS